MISYSFILCFRPMFSTSRTLKSKNKTVNQAVHEGSRIPNLCSMHSDLAPCCPGPQRGQIETLGLGLLRDAQEARRLQTHEDLASGPHDESTRSFKWKHFVRKCIICFYIKFTRHLRVTTICTYINIAAAFLLMIQRISKQSRMFKILLTTDPQVLPAGRAPAVCRSTP